MVSLGLDIGYSSINLALVDETDQVAYEKYVLHKGNIKQTLKEMLEEALSNYRADQIQYGAITGSGSRFLEQSAGIGTVNEITATVEGSLALNPDIRSIIDIGGQRAKYITDFKATDRSHIKMSMNTSCSAGTGSFLEEQISRLNLTLADYSTYACQARSIPRIAGRCSVFAKTDIIHHQQEGVPVEDILLGLAYAVIRNYKGAVMRKLPLKKPIFFVGGVAHNQGIICALEDVLKLDPGELIIHDSFSNASAIGVAIIARQGRQKLDPEHLIRSLATLNEDNDIHAEETRLPVLNPWGKNDSLSKHICVPASEDNDHQGYYLGIDIGSTSTNLVVMNADHEIVAFRYLRTLGDPIEAVEKGFAELNVLFEGQTKMTGVGITGSGRYLIGNLIGVDVIKDEISAQARAAIAIDPEVDTIFEIGGQDSKYISLKDGAVSDFQMNKICAAGTGSFLEEQANKFNLPIDEFGEIALASPNPINLGERCTVFIETSIAANLSKGAEMQDIVAGLCYSVAKNYLARVVGQKPIGKKILFQGGVAHNQGVVNAFRSLVGDKLEVPPFFSVTGAYGAALMAKEQVGDQPTRFRGLGTRLRERFLANQKKAKPAKDHSHTFAKQVEDLIFRGYDGSIDPNKQTVGIPRALFTFGMFSMFNAFFKALGFNVVLSDPSSEYTIGLGQEHALDETCYPVKLINGHVAELVRKQVDYIFFPDLYTVDHPDSPSRQNFGCAYMQLAFKVVNRAMELEKLGIELLAPTIAFSLGKEFMQNSFAALGRQLGRTSEQTNLALQKGMQAFQDFDKRIEQNAQKTMQEIKPDEKVFVIISKIYGVVDPVLNMGIPEKLMEMGYKVIPFFYLPETDISREHPNMFWPFAQHILEPAKLIRQHPNLYAVLLTHHGCGPDSVVAHYFREMMGEKPYLYIEVDEHSSSVGIITRVEAFINSLDQLKIEQSGAEADESRQIASSKTRIKTGLQGLARQAHVYLPYLYPYSDLFCEMLAQKGMAATVLPRTTKTSSDLGRKFTMTEEYFSLTALLGDLFKTLYQAKDNANPVALLLPQTEGAEVEGQYSRFLRSKLDEEGLEEVEIVAPFVEDFPGGDANTVEQVFLGLLACDIVLAAPAQGREHYLNTVRDWVKTDRLALSSLKNLANDVFTELKATPGKKKILAIGEMLTLYNEFLNDFTFSTLEQQGHRVVYSPLSEYMWMIWQDYAAQNPQQGKGIYQQRLDELKTFMNSISDCLADESHFEAIPERLIDIASETVGYYAGANGRYREAKMLSSPQTIDGIINVFSMYENTGISLNVLHKGFEKGDGKPVLSLTFDGNKNENDKTRIESFIYYL